MSLSEEDDSARFRNFQEVEDMIFLPELTLETLLTNLQLRYDKGKIYTYTGAILVSLNPYRSLPIYTLDIAQRYFSLLFYFFQASF
ncbi:MAG: hypothetical protein Q8P67_25015 [archaeon]|nr:hypothetical protein [archaeon]